MWFEGDLSQDMEKWRALCERSIIPRGSIRLGNFLRTERVLASQEGLHSWGKLLST